MENDIFEIMDENGNTTFVFALYWGATDYYIKGTWEEISNAIRKLGLNVDIKNIIQITIDEQIENENYLLNF